MSNDILKQASVIEVLRTVDRGAGRATYYPLAHETKYNIPGLMRMLESAGYVTHRDEVRADGGTTRYYTITEAGRANVLVLWEAIASLLQMVIRFMALR